MFVLKRQVSQQNIQIGTQDKDILENHGWVGVVMPSQDSANGYMSVHIDVPIL